MPREREATDLLRSLIHEVCDLCDGGKPLRQWGQPKNGTLSFTHWTGFEHVPCKAARIHDLLDRAEPTKKQEGSR